MSYCLIFIDRCRCPHGSDKFGNLEEFHDAADEITEAINAELGINPEEQREI